MRAHVLWTFLLVPLYVFGDGNFTSMEDSARRRTQDNYRPYGARKSTQHGYHAIGDRPPSQILTDPETGVVIVKDGQVVPAARQTPPMISRPSEVLTYPLGETNTALRAMTKAQVLLNAMQSGDVNAASELTAPEALRAIGGVSGLASSIRELQMDSNYDCRITGIPCMTQTDGMTFAIVTTRARITYKGERALLSSYLIGTSMDRGITWCFLNGSDRAKTRLLSQFPVLKNDLQFPTRTLFVGESSFSEISGTWLPNASTRIKMNETVQKQGGAY
jgi:hypothetical protein